MLATKLRLTGDTQGRIWLSRLTRWQLAEEGEPPELAIANTEFLAAMEYRYDAGRQRYLVRPRKPDDLLPYNDGQGGWLLDNGTWHEYTGQSIYGDYAVAFDETTGEAEVTETFAHAPGAVQYDYAQPAGARRQNLRGNLVGTTERMVGESGVVTQRSVYTAFGELAYQAGVGQTRYGYCGAWGYQAASGVGGYVDPLAELGWLHVGERYYDPASGRFMQRDPIGIAGGWNTYAYVENEPPTFVDLDGLLRYLVRDTTGLRHEAVILQVGPSWFVRVDFGPWSGDNVRITGACTVAPLLRSTDIVKNTRNTTTTHDQKTLNKAITKYGDKWYFLVGRNCWNVSRKLFGDAPPTVPGLP